MSRRRPWPVVVVVLLVGALSSACVGPVLVDDHYRGKAISSLDASRSSVAAVELLARQIEQEHVPGPMTSVIIRQKEEEAAWHADAFATRQPPPGGDDLRAQVLPLLEEAASTVAELRIAAFRGRLADVAGAAPRLADLVHRLEGLKAQLEQRTGPR